MFIPLPKNFGTSNFFWDAKLSATSIGNEPLFDFLFQSTDSMDFGEASVILHNIDPSGWDFQG